MNMHPSGSSALGVPVMHVASFDYTQQAELANGLNVYKPAAGEILLGGLMLNEIVWNGTTPVGDFGSSTNGFTGYFEGIIAGMDMTQIGAPETGTRAGLSTWDISPITFVNGIMFTHVTGPFPQDVTVSYPAISSSGIFPDSPLPARFDGSASIRVIVSQDGTTASAPPGATQGSSKLYFMTVMPKPV